MIERYKLYYRLFLTIFWIETCFGFVAEELLPFIEPLRNVLFLLCDVATLVLGLLTIRKKGDLAVFISFFVLAIISTVIINGESWMTMLNGSRDFFGLILAIPIMRWFFLHKRSDEFKRLMIKQLKIWMWLQAFCVTEQFIRYGANDHGGGTMGFGASGMTSMMIYLVSFFLVTRNWDSDNYFNSLRKNWIYVFLLFPSFLNETKVSFILLALYFILLIKYDRKLIVRLAIILPVSVAAFIGLGNIYLNVTQQEADEVLSEEFFTQYLYGLNLDEMIDVAIMVQDGDIEVDPRDWWVVDIPRIAKLTLIIPELRECKGGLMLGAGVGQFKGGSLVHETRFANYNKWLLQGSRPWLFFLIVQLGIIGILWFFVIIVYNVAVRHSKRQFSTRVQLFIAAAILIVLFYNDSLRVFNWCVLLFLMPLLCRYYDDDELNKSEGQESGLYIP